MKHAFMKKVLLFLRDLNLWGEKEIINAFNNKYLLYVILSRKISENEKNNYESKGVKFVQFKISRYDKILEVDVLRKRYE